MKKYCPPLPRTRSRPLYGHTFSCMVRFAALSDQWPLYESIYVTNKINRKSKSLKLTSIQLSLNRPYSSWILLPFLPFAHSAWYVNLSLACDNVNGPSVNQACHVKIKRNHCFQADSWHILLWNLFFSQQVFKKFPDVWWYSSVLCEAGGMARSDQTGNQRWSKNIPHFVHENTPH